MHSWQLSVSVTLPFPLHPVAQCSEERVHPLLLEVCVVRRKWLPLPLSGSLNVTRVNAGDPLGRWLCKQPFTCCK